MKKNILFLITITLLAFSSCKEDEPVLGEAPTVADAAFTFVESASTLLSNNYVGNHTKTILHALNARHSHTHAQPIRRECAAQESLL